MIIETTGATEVVILEGLLWTDDNDLELVHPQTLNLAEYYDGNDIRQIRDLLQSYVDDGEIALSDPETGQPITDVVAVTSNFNPTIPSYVPCSGRFYMESNKRWVTDSDDNYGTSYFQFIENAGTGSEPIVEWEHLGTLIPKGRIVKQLMICGKANSTQVSDLDIRITAKSPKAPNLWTTGIDNDNEVDVITLFSGKFVESGWSGNMADLRKKNIDLGNHILADDSMLSIYMRPIGNLNGRRYFSATWTWEIE